MHDRTEQQDFLQNEEKDFIGQIFDIILSIIITSWTF